jgi:hydrogenase maturation protein HypF
MTSGNRSEQPIVLGLDEARDRLSGIADVLLLHDREITGRYDDSVVRVVNSEPLLLRRARGYAPYPLELPIPAREPLIAVGAQLKNTFTLAAGRRAYVSQHIGDLDDVDTIAHFDQTLRSYRRLFGIDPAVAVCDLHPDYVSTGIAEGLSRPRLMLVQHHHAHIAAVMAEHDRTDPVVGVAFDGSGYGEDGTVWGGEFLVADLREFHRAGHLRVAPLPGGDLAARSPWRSALGYASLGGSAEQLFPDAFAAINSRELRMARQQVVHRLNTPLSSSMGRLFDAAAALLGVRCSSQYEGQAAMELESLAGDEPAAALPFPAVRGSGGWILDPVPLLEAMGKMRSQGAGPATIAAAFHESVGAASAEVAGLICRDQNIETVALGGGVFQNARLLSILCRRLSDLGLRVLIPRRLGPNDGAISYGQAAIAAARLFGERSSCA